MNDKITVIVIIYNVEKYLAECLDSIVNQTYKNLEIILVNDGSSDSSKNICEEYAKKDSRVVVIHKENGGLVSARKKGIEKATGKYVTFVDGDDWIEIEAFEYLYCEIKKYHADIVASGIIRDTKGNLLYDLNRIREDSYDKSRLEKEIYPFMMYEFKNSRPMIDASLCNKLFLTDLIKAVLFRVDDRIYYLGEDAATTYPCMLNANSIRVIDYAYYHHRIIPTNESMPYKRENLYERLIFFYNFMKEEFRDTKYEEIMDKQLKAYFVHSLKKAISEDIGLDLYNCCQIISAKKESVQYTISLDEINKNDRVVLYGAGDVGKALYKQFVKEHINLVLWVDKEYEIYKELGYPIESVEEISKKDYDTIIVAVKKSIVAESIKKELIERNIDSNKIRWIEPIASK